MMLEVRQVNNNNKAAATASALTPSNHATTTRSARRRIFQTITKVILILTFVYQFLVGFNRFQRTNIVALSATTTANNTTTTTTTTITESSNIATTAVVENNIADNSNTQDYNKTLHIVDTILYNGEPIVLTRLELLYPVVDRIYITEGNITFSGNPKPMYSVINKHLFKLFEDKITWLYYIDPPGFSLNNFHREKLQRDYAIQAIKQDFKAGRLKKPFVILNTDADEIPNPHILGLFQPGRRYYEKVTSTVMFLRMKYFYYNCNWIHTGDWRAGHTLPGQMVVDGTYTFDQFRASMKMQQKYNYCIQNGGWHLSYMLSVDDIINKLESFSHQEYNLDSIKSKQHIYDCIINGKDLFGRTSKRHQLQYFNYTKLPIPIQRYHEKVVQIQKETSAD